MKRKRNLPESRGMSGPTGCADSISTKEQRLEQGYCPSVPNNIEDDILMPTMMITAMDDKDNG